MYLSFPGGLETLTRLSDQIPELNDKYLSISDNSVGVFADQQPLQVYNVTESDGSTSLHTWPIGIVDRALTLVNPLPGGGDGDVGETGDLYDLKDTVPNQRADRGESPTTKPSSSWDDFDLNEQTREVEWLGSEGEDNEQKWVVFPAPAGEENFVVRWRGGAYSSLLLVYPEDLIR